MRNSIFDENKKACLAWLDANYLSKEVPWKELDGEFRAWSAEKLGKESTFAGVYSWAVRRGLLKKTRSGARPSSKEKKKTTPSNGDLATLVDIIYGLESLTADQKFNAVRELIKD